MENIVVGPLLQLLFASSANALFAFNLAKKI